MGSNPLRLTLLLALLFCTASYGATGLVFDGYLEKPLSREALGAELHGLFTPSTG